MHDKWGWELLQLSIDTCCGWQQQIEDWRRLCEWWKTNLKTYVFWESFKITVTINNFLSCCLMKQTKSSIYIHSLARKCYTFLFHSFGTSSTILLIRFSIYMLHFPKPLKTVQSWQPQGCRWWIEILWWPEVMSAFLHPPFPWHQKWTYGWRETLKIWRTNWIYFEWKELFRLFRLAKRVLQLQLLWFSRQKPYINKK